MAANTYKLGELYLMSNEDDQVVLDELKSKIEQLLALIDARLTTNEADIVTLKAEHGL